MGATAFYALPYPDAASTVDVPRDVKALADKLELWKNGFTVPSGNLTVGSDTATQRWVDVLYKDGAVSRVGRLVMTADALWQLRGIAGGVLAGYLQMGADGTLVVNSGGANRPLPFAMYAYNPVVTLTAAASGSTTVNYPANRFTAATFVAATPFNTSNYFGYFLSSTLTSVNVGASHKDGTAGTATVTVHVIVVQPTAGGVGLRREDEPYTHFSTCHVAGCENEGVPIGNIDPADTVVCGPCGNTIDEVRAR